MLPACKCICACSIFANSGLQAFVKSQLELDIVNVRSNLFSRGVYLCLLATVLFMVAAVVNGYPFFFNDTRSYVRQPAVILKALTKHDFVSDWPSSVDTADHGDVAAGTNTQSTVKNNGITSNRSIYYGFLALLGYLVGNFWMTAFIQSAWTAIAGYILVSHTTRAVSKVYPISVIITSVCTCVGFYTGYIMPDIFAPIMILSACSLFLFYQHLRVGEITFVVVSIAFSILAHPSHQVILFAMSLCVSIWVWLAGIENIKLKKPIFVVAGCILFGILGQFAFNKGLEVYTGEKPLLLPHLEAHLIDMGPGSDFAKTACDPDRFVVCRYKDRFPMYWETFIGDPDPNKGVFAPADFQTKRRLSDEQIPFALAVMRHDPLGLLGGLARDAVMQLFRFSLKDFVVDKAAIANYEGRFPRNVAEHIDNSVVSTSPKVIDFLSSYFALAAATAVAFIAYIFLTRRARSDDEQGGENVLRVSSFLVLGVVVNGLVCGLLASPYDRFQARVIWLVVFAAALMGAQFLGVRSESARRVRKEF